MSIVKSFSVGLGDTFYIKHNNDNFTIIDCFLKEENKKEIVDEIISESSDKTISRFISTHPDNDHFKGIKYLDGRKEIINFYCIKNEATKKDQDDDFDKYCELRDSNKACYLKKGLTRKWLNDSNDERGASGIHILWPDTNNQYYKDELKKAKKGEAFNNISAIVQYNAGNGAKVLWMGDLETDFMKNIKDKIKFDKINILFAPHHGRTSGEVPSEWLEKMNPDIIVMGEAKSKDLDYLGYDDYNKITQNTAGDITFDFMKGKINVYVSSDNYSVDFLDNENLDDMDDNSYLGTLNL